MTSGSKTIAIQKAKIADLQTIKQLADKHKIELGFIIRGALEKSIRSGELLVAVDEQLVLCGFVQYRHRKDEQTTLYNIVVAAEFRQQGIGQKLIEELILESKAYRKERIVLKCPVELLANQFYRACGFMLGEVEAGKHRSLNIWQLALV